MFQEHVTQGTDFFDVLQARDRDGSLPAYFLPDDFLSSVLWRGADHTSLFSPTVTWHDAPSGTIDFSIAAAQSATLDGNGTYRCQVFVTRAGVISPVADFLVEVTPSAGVATQATLVYCTSQDLLDIAPWIAGVQDADVDVQGFYRQRLKARLWLDDIIVNRFQNNYVGLYGAHSESAFEALGTYQSIGPNQIIIDALAANQLILRPAVVQVCAHYAVGQIGLAQIVTGSKNLAMMGQFHLSKANRDVLGITAEIDTNADGIGEMFANLSTINTMLG